MGCAQGRRNSSTSVIAPSGTTRRSTTCRWLDAHRVSIQSCLRPRESGRRPMQVNFILRLWRSMSNYKKALLLVFVLCLPFLDAHVGGDCVGLYASVRSPLIVHDFSFSSDC